MSRSEQDVDLIDTLLDIDDNSTIYAARHFRDEVLVGTQESYDALFSEELSLPLNIRFLVALYASTLSQAKELTTHYEAELRNISGTREALEAEVNGVLTDDLTLIEDPIVRAVLEFTRTLILNPLASDKNALLALEASGISVADCIALAQLIAFLSYQIRLVSGLRAMQILEKSA